MYYTRGCCALHVRVYTCACVCTSYLLWGYCALRWLKMGAMAEVRLRHPRSVHIRVLPTKNEIAAIYPISIPDENSLETLIESPQQKGARRR